MKSMKALAAKLAWLSALAGGVALVILLPLVHVLLAAFNFVIHFGVMLLQWLMVRQPRVEPKQVRLGSKQPFVSIHVPAHNEPSEMLKRTLDSLAELDWDNYEVLVIDNNTTDESLWRPIEAYCWELGSRFRFLHVEGLPGFKAGAMNWARQYMSSEAEFIFVVDADYLVDRNGLKTAMKYFSAPDIGLIQFPQDYRNVGAGNMGIALDFKHFFSSYMTMANRFDCVPSTGTLSLVQIKALNSIEGFSTDVITEDADLGLRLGMKGYRTVYGHESIGHGVVPHDLEGLKKQRWRWAFGNAQILKLGWRKLLLNKQLSLKQKLGYVAHLTAWFNFNLFPSLSLVVLAGVALVADLTAIQQGTLAISAATLASFFLIRFMVLYTGLKRDGHTLRQILAAFASHVGMGWIFSASWLKCLWDHRSPFIRTNKFVDQLIPGPVRSTMVELGLGVTLVAACGVLTALGHYWGAAAALAMAAGRMLIYSVWSQTRATLELTKRVEAGEKISRHPWTIQTSRDGTVQEVSGSGLVLKET